MSKKGNSLSKGFWIILIILCIILSVFVGIMFVIYSKKSTKVINTVETGGNITLNYTNNVTGLSIVNAVPMTDVLGMAQDKDGSYFDFSVNIELDNATSIEYEIAAIKDENNSTIKDQDIRIYLEKEDSGTYFKVDDPKPYVGLKEKSKLGSQKGAMILNTVTTKKSITDNYRLRLWLSDTAILPNNSYTVEIVINGKAK